MSRFSNRIAEINSLHKKLFLNQEALKPIVSLQDKLLSFIKNKDLDDIPFTHQGSACIGTNLMTHGCSEERLIDESCVSLSKQAAILDENINIEGNNSSLWDLNSLANRIQILLSENNEETNFPENCIKLRKKKFQLFLSFLFKLKAKVIRAIDKIGILIKTILKAFSVEPSCNSTFEIIRRKFRLFPKSGKDDDVLNLSFREFFIEFLSLRYCNEKRKYKYISYQKDN